MNTQSLVLAVFAAVTFFGGILQAVAAWIDIKKHTTQSKQKKKWLALILICMLLTVIFGIASYISYNEKEALVPTPIPTTPTSVATTPTSVATTPISILATRTPLSSNPTSTDQMLKNYEAYINDLVLNHGLSLSKQGDDVNNLAHTETLSTLPQLDNSGKRSLLQFLRNAQLIGYDHYIIFLNNVDLSHADLNHVDLSGVNLNRANLSYTNLSDADLSGSNIGNVNFTNTNLNGAIFLGNDLANANANLSGAIMPDGKKHP